MDRRPFPSSRSIGLRRTQLGPFKLLPLRRSRKKLGRIARSRPKRGICSDQGKGQTQSTPKKAKGAPEDALQKLEKLVRTGHNPLALKDLVMKAHLPYPFSG
jgi:hypothetical protein